MRWIFISVLAFLVIVLLGNAWLGNITKRIQLFSPISPKPASQTPTGDIPRLAVISENLEIPWEIVFLPDKSALITERPGRIRLLSKNGVLSSHPVATISEVKHFGEGGLLGITLHPEFKKNHFVYVYYTYSQNGENTLNKIVRYTFEKDSLTNPKTLVDSIPGAIFHNGGRIKFGPDGLLYVTTGDARQPSLSQNKNALAGKILRMTADGKVGPDNPFNNYTYSYGHRNPQGLAWDNQGNLWETEHGQSAHDEVNKIEAGHNYGWPIIQGDEKQQDMTSPVIQSGNDTWAPSGTSYLEGFFYFAGLKGNALYRLDPKTNSLKMFLKDELGRIRSVTVGPDNLLYILTNNRDGRGIPGPNDDKIIRLNPKLL
ncbi:MAG: PQQ-dependent sugar dehydrogenase [Candidatus Levybacteria bacterium]|nr:PQQ-dependent sugar dehydrogenase [Candidatus Levybacteria bacterium]